jgi:hypothetical protein
LAIAIVGSASPLTRADPPKKSAFKVGDKVEIYMEGTVEGEIIEIDPNDGWLTVRCTVHGREMTPMLPPDQVKPINTKKAKDTKPKSTKATAKASPPDKAETAADGSQNWTDDTGKHKMKAEFVELRDGKVTLKKADGSTVKVPLERLSPADRKRAETLAAQAAKSSAENEENPSLTDKKSGGESIKKGNDSVKKDAKPITNRGGDLDQKPGTGRWTGVRRIMIDPPATAKIVPDALVGGPAEPPKPFDYVTPTRGFRPRVKQMFIDQAHQRAVMSYYAGGSKTGQQLDYCDLAAGKALFSATIDTIAKPIDLSPDGSLLLCVPTSDAEFASNEKKRGLEIWKMQPKPELVASWNAEEAGDFFHNKIEHAWFLSAEHLMTYDAWNARLTLWSIKGGKPVYSVKCARHCSPCFSPNRRQLALMTDAGPVVLDAVSGKTLALLPGGPDNGTAMAFRQDGRQLASLSDNQLRIWDLEKNELCREVWLARRVPDRGLDWVDNDHLLASWSFLIDIPRRIVLWHYHPGSVGPVIGGKLSCAVAESNDDPANFAADNPAGAKVNVFFASVPHPEAAAVAQGLTDDKLLVVKPGIEAALNVQFPGTPDEIRKVTEKITAELKRNEIKIVPGAAITLEAVADQGKTESQSYRNMMREDAITITRPATGQVVRLMFVEKGHVLWERWASYGTDQSRLTPAEFFLQTPLPRYVAREGTNGTYGASLLTPQGPRAYVGQ